MKLERRAAIFSEIESEFGVVIVMNTHLSLNHLDRLRAAERLRELAEGAGPSTMLCGDMNAPPESEEIRYLAEEAGLKDAGAASNEPTFSSDNPSARIDYVWHSQGLTVTELAAVQTEASDHLPIVARVNRY
jgi:endonuclease/exonuclease/phosphatase family metal-dependent hydrolase